MAPQDLAKSRVEQMYRGGGVAEAGVTRAVRSVHEAQRGLARFCASAGSPTTSAAVRSLAAVASSEPSAARAVAEAVNRSADSSLSDEQRQQVILALSNPAQYPLATDRYLGSLLHVPGERLGEFDLAVARSLAYQDLTGDTDSGSLRNLFHCVNYGICVQFPADDEFPMASAAARRIVDLIRTQRWASLGFR